MKAKKLVWRAKKAKRTPLPCVSIHNRDYWHSVVEKRFQLLITQWSSIHRMMAKAYTKHVGATSKYMPHQGKQEVARRLNKLQPTT